MTERVTTQSYDHCTVCGGEYVAQCRCMRSDRYCANGHRWHTCVVHRVRVEGGSDHGKSGCTCGRGNG